MGMSSWSCSQVRAGLKEFSNWPTYPQVYVKGKLLGGLDIVKEMKEEGELKSMFPAPVDAGDVLESRLKRIITASPVVLVMKGSPEVREWEWRSEKEIFSQVYHANFQAPRCGFSRQMVEILQKAGISFTSFDILTDDSVCGTGLSCFSWVLSYMILCFYRLDKV